MFIATQKQILITGGINIGFLSTVTIKFHRFQTMDQRCKDSKEKHKRILIYNFKVYLVVAFCFALVTLYSMIFGSQNSVVGVLVLLVLMILRQVDFGIDTKHSIGVIFMIFAILAVGPRLANTVNTVPAFLFIFFVLWRS